LLLDDELALGKLLLDDELATLIMLPVVLKCDKTAS